MSRICFLFALLMILGDLCRGLTSEICWNNEGRCQVQATIYQVVPNATRPDTMPFDINCFEDDETTTNQRQQQEPQQQQQQVAPAAPSDKSNLSSNEIRETESSSLSSSLAMVPTLPISETPPYLKRFFERAPAIILNGCHTLINAHTFGLEYLSKCDRISEIIIERFHVDLLMPLRCSSETFMRLETLRFTNNEIATVGAQSFSNLALLRDLYFSHNSLRNIERFAFDRLNLLKDLTIEQEPLLILQEYDLFSRSNLTKLKLISVKRMNPKIFQYLPRTLNDIHVENTVIGLMDRTHNKEVNKENDKEKDDEESEANSDDDDDDNSTYSVNITGAEVLQNISIVNCNLTRFTLSNDHGALKFLNLSFNALREFQIFFNDSAVSSSESEEEDEEMTMNLDLQPKSSLEVLDLSYNKLTTLPPDWLHSLEHLKILRLDNNLFKVLSLPQLLNNLPEAQFIDLSHNNLLALRDTSEEVDCARVRLRVDSNPWNCMWLLDFSHTHPEKFRILQYEKFLSQINVNGLECAPEDSLPMELLTDSTTPVAEVLRPFDATKRNLNVSRDTVIYGNPFNKPRSQRAHALIIVFMLPVGIAILFLFLYLWIYCQRMFHLSYYRSNPFCGLCLRKNPSIITTPPQNLVTNRFDVVRQLPPQTTLANGNFNYIGNSNCNGNNNENYEMPVNGVTSECNCNNKLMHDGKCPKTHHITYVATWPNEKPQKIYEEIIEAELPEISASTDPMDHKNSIYDHLRFE